MCKRRLPVGAEVQADGGVHVRVWAPRCRHVEVAIQGRGGKQQVVPLAAEANGYFAGFEEKALPGDCYGFRLDHRREIFPDPVSRFQPEGSHGPSEIVDPTSFAWSDPAWPGVRLEGQVVYEMHIGAFTSEGTWQAAMRQLAELADLGVTLLELMPVADFPGRFGWGYDGVNLFAPTRLYGRPDDFRAFVDRAHSVGLGVILDVVYNHYGPDGNSLLHFSKDYVSARHENEWGEAVNFDGANSGPVREFILTNAGYWIDEFHLDGLRIDATQQTFDDSSPHILTEVVQHVRAAAAGRSTVVIGENEPQHAQLLRPAETGGNALDALWNDDFHHSAMVALTSHNEAYYTDYLGTPQEFISAVKWGFLYQGQHYRWQKQARGTPVLDMAPARFVQFLQNHDQVANSGLGLRCHQLTSPGRYRALTALLLLAPQTPMLFQGQEFAASAPFCYFADHPAELAERVRKGRTEFLTQFRNLALPEVQACLPDLADASTFERCKLNFAERQLHSPIYKLHRDLLHLRRDDSVFRSQRRRAVDGAVLGPQAFVLRFFAESGHDRLLLMNLGSDLRLEIAPEPLLAPPEGGSWQVFWSSESSQYGGLGTPPVLTDGCWRIPGEAAVVLALRTANRFTVARGDAEVRDLPQGLCVY